MRRFQLVFPVLLGMAAAIHPTPSQAQVGIGISIWLFSNQSKYHGVVVKSHPGVGDLTFEVGFVIAAGLYYVLYLATRPAQGPRLQSAPAQ